jgi:hypothetical protein
VLVTAASVQDHDAARPLLWNMRRAFPGQAGLGRRRLRRKARHLAASKLKPKLTQKTVRRPDGLHTSRCCPAGWMVERTLSWIIRHRRTVRDYERLPDHHETYLYWAVIIVMTRRLACRHVSSQAGFSASEYDETCQDPR